MPFWLIGMMGAGKSVAGEALAARLGVEFADTDALVVETAGIPLPVIWEELGEEHFRTLERAAVERAAGLGIAVVATGGGVVLHEPNVTTMRRTGSVIWLDASPDTLALRIGIGEGRPLLTTSDRLSGLVQLAQARQPLYEAAAHHRVDTEDMTVSEVVDVLESMWTA
ncbi:MAG TPA: shikimate kinase [Acidimicrobiia bacterium]|nr:shikimate kinase [Acidimicrobiia bacterium]